VETRRRIQDQSVDQEQVGIIFLTKPKSVQEAINGEYWVKAMEEELSQIENNNTWELVPRPESKNVIGENGSLETNWMNKVMSSETKLD